TGLASIRPRLRSSLSPPSHLSTTSVRGEIGARAHPVVVAEDLPRASHLKNGSEHGDTDNSPRQATVHSRGTPIPRTYRESWGTAQQQESKEPRQNRGSRISYSDPEVTRNEPRVLSRTMSRCRCRNLPFAVPTRRPQLALRSSPRQTRGASRITPWCPRSDVVTRYDLGLWRFLVGKGGSPCAALDPRS